MKNRSRKNKIAVASGVRKEKRGKNVRPERSWIYYSLPERIDMSLSLYYNKLTRRRRGGMYHHHDGGDGGRGWRDKAVTLM